MRAKILIVGGGVMGTALAVRAAQRTDPLREPVVLFERGQIGSGSTGGSGAILRTLYADRILSLMARDSIREYASFESRTGRSIGFTRSGVMMIAGPDQPEWQEKIRTWTADLREYGIEIEAIGASEIRQHLPGIEIDDGVIASWEPRAGFVDPHETVDAFAALARTYGAVTRLSTEVEELLVENGRVTGARTSEGICTADQVVVMGGPWSAKLLQSAGVDLPLKTIVPENCFFSLPESDVEADAKHAVQQGRVGFDIEDPSEKTTEVDVLLPRGLHPVLIDLQRGFYCRCEPARLRTRVGRIDYEGDQVLEDPDQKPEHASPELVSWARERIVARLPEYADRPDAGDVTSWYTLTPDAQPMLGPVPEVEGLFVATGFSGHGFKLAPAVAEGLTQMMFGDPVTAFEPEFFAPTRFEGDEEWGGRFGL